MICLVYCDQSFFNVPHLNPVGCYSFIMYASLETDFDNFDNFRDISSNDKRLVRVGAKTFVQTGTYITIKLYKKDKEATGEFESMADNYTKIKRLTNAKNCDVTGKLRKKRNKSKKTSCSEKECESENDDNCRVV